VVFVPYVLPGEVVECLVLREKKSWCEASLLHIIEPSSLRREPFCPHFGLCGGCHYQHMPYQHQLALKEAIFRSILHRQAAVSKSRISPIIPSLNELEWRSRAKLALSAGKKEGQSYWGFYKAGSHEVIEISACPVLKPSLRRLVDPMNSMAGLIKYAFPRLDGMILEAGLDGRARVVIQPESIDMGQIKALEQPFRELEIPVAIMNSKRGLVYINCFEELCFYKGPLCEKGLSTLPGTFFQANLQDNENLVKKVIELCNKAKAGKILELFSGSGNFSIPLSAAGFHVTAVESEKGSVESAKKNRDRILSSPERLEIIHSDAVRFFSEVPRKDLFDVVLLDPPRQGAKRLSRLLAESGIKTVIYVSCDPMTLSRDVRILGQWGFRVKECIPFDMFPQTFHIESVTMLSRRRD